MGELLDVLLRGDAQSVEGAAHALAGHLFHLVPGAHHLHGHGLESFFGHVAGLGAECRAAALGLFDHAAAVLLHEFGSLPADGDDLLDLGAPAGGSAAGGTGLGLAGGAAGGLAGGLGWACHGGTPLLLNDRSQSRVCH